MKRRCTLVAWEQLCSLKDEGGLRFLQLDLWNCCALEKLFWNVCSKKDSLWVKWIHAVYFWREDIWAYRPSTYMTSVFQQVLRVRDKLQLLLQWLAAGLQVYHVRGLDFGGE